MTITSTSFAFFFVVLCICYFCLPKKAQWPVLLVFSYIFYFFASEQLPIYIMVTTAVAYFATIFMSRIKKNADLAVSANDDISREEKKGLRKKADKKRKIILVVAICINIGLLSVFKYSGILLNGIANFTGSFGVKLGHENFNLILPLGISFYTFQSVGYMIDIYRKKVEAEKNFFKVALFVSYFPQIIQGPIGRFDALAPQLFAQHKFDFVEFKKGVMLILWGMLKKLVIADNLSPLTHEMMANYSSYEGIQILIGIILFGIQLYADFSGYMDIVSGFSNVLGIKIAENFKRPYLSKNITEFWRRWHMSLCFWFRDYVFYSIFMSKRMMNLAKKLRTKGHKTAAKNIPTYIAMIVVWFLTGLWHNLNGPQIFWGLANGLIMICAIQFKPGYEKVARMLHIRDESAFWNFIKIIRTYFIMTLLNFFSEFPTWTDVVTCVQCLFAKITPSTISLSYLLPKTVDIGIVGVVMTFCACMLLLANSLYEEKYGSVIEKICSKNWVLQLMTCVGLFFAIILFGGLAENSGGFMYAQF